VHLPVLGAPQERETRSEKRKQGSDHPPPPPAWVTSTVESGSTSGDPGKKERRDHLKGKVTPEGSRPPKREGTISRAPRGESVQTQVPDVKTTKLGQARENHNSPCEHNGIVKHKRKKGGQTARGADSQPHQEASQEGKFKLPGRREK